MRDSWRCAFAALALCLTPGPLTAAGPPAAPAEEQAPEQQKNEPSTEEPKTKYAEEITVTSEKEPSLTVPSPEAAARELALVPGGTSFVPAETWERGRAATVADALGFAPGVLVQPRFGAEEARLSIRGSGLQRTFHGRGLKLLQDGVPLNLADGSFDFQAVEPLGTRYVEVLRGANALERGAATLGGSINYVSRSGHEASPFSARIESGAFGYQRGQVSTGFAEGRFDAYASLTHGGQESFRRHAAQSNQRLFANLGWRLDDDRESRIYLAAVHTDSELPGNLTQAQLAENPRQAAAGNLALDQKRDFDLFRLANRTTLRIAEGRRLDLGAFWFAKRLDHPIFQVIDQRSDDFGAELRYQDDSDRFGRRNRLVLGLVPAVGFVDDRRFRNLGGRRGAPTAAGETTSVNLDLYAEERHELRPGLWLSAGLQLAHAGRDFADRFRADGDQTDAQEFRGASPKLGLLFDLTPGVTLFANLSRSFEPPTFGELVNVGGDGLLRLDAQTATTLEAGSRGAAGPLAWDLALYHARVADELLSQNDAVGNPLGTINAGRTTHSGAELGLELRRAAPGGSLLLRQAYTWSRFCFDGDRVFAGNTLAGVPEHFLRAELLYERARGFYGGPSVEWVPSRYPVDHANTLFADPYTVFGLKLGYRTERGLAGFVEGKNMTDETYAATTGVIADARGRDSAQFLPGDGASFFACLEYRR